MAEAHDPFNTTENYDGKITGQSGVNERFNTILIDRYASFFPMNPHDASFISDPTDFAFDACLNAHSLVESILLADRSARRGLSSYTDDYYDRFYNLTAAALIKQLSDASTDVGSYWLTAWTPARKSVRCNCRGPTRGSRSYLTRAFARCFRKMTRSAFSAN